MHWIDYAIFGVYLTVMLGIGFYFMRKNKSADDYFVGGRKMSSFHIGLSVDAAGFLFQSFGSFLAADC
jgi:solute:Na+ symporter, SSS family